MTYDEAWLAQQLRKPGYRVVGSPPARPLAPEAPEADLQGRIHQLCTHLGLLYYHAVKSRLSTPGLPDCLIVHPDGGPLYAWELKRTGAQPSPAQRRWLDALARATRIETGRYAPADWPHLQAVLTRRTEG
jgi:hypothetical protein